MKAIKVLVAGFALSVLASAPALQAESKAHQNQIDKIGATVGSLSFYQQYAIGTILDKAQAQVDALAPSDRRTKAGDIRKAAMAEVRKNLTPAQQKKFDAGH